jgi:hypothetical protein
MTESAAIRLVSTAVMVPHGAHRNQCHRLSTFPAYSAQNESVFVPTLRVVGREEELGAIVRLFETPGQLPGTIVVAGEAGIGKTTLWLAGSDAGAAGGYRVLPLEPPTPRPGCRSQG